MSYVYIPTDGGRLFTVGFYDPDGKWIAAADFSNIEEAELKVNFLNGGPAEGREFYKRITQANNAMVAAFNARDAMQRDLSILRENKETFRKLIEDALTEAGAPTHWPKDLESEHAKPLTPQQRIQWLVEARNVGNDSDDDFGAVVEVYNQTQEAKAQEVAKQTQTYICSRCGGEFTGNSGLAYPICDTCLF